MFTPEGELRPGFEPEDSAPEGSPPPGRPAPKVAAPSATTEAPSPAAEPDAATSAGPRTEFARIVSSLATTAYSALGLLSDSESGARHRDLAVARQMIDWLAVLEQKTRGNLSFEESDLLSRVLYELRLAYVEVGRGSTK
jgi:hypothetical protein